MIGPGGLFMLAMLFLSPLVVVGLGFRALPRRLGWGLAALYLIGFGVPLTLDLVQEKALERTVPLLSTHLIAVPLLLTALAVVWWLRR